MNKINMNTEKNHYTSGCSRIIRKRKAARKAALIKARKTAAMLILFMALVLSGFCGRRMVNAMAKDSSGGPSRMPAEKYYTSIRIEEGDSLWSLAKKYGAGSDRDTLNYVRELRQINRLAGDTIHAGHYLTVVYYK